MRSPTELTLKKCRDDGLVPEVTEHFNRYSRTRHDLYGFIDILVMTGDGFLGIQATSDSNVAHRVKKIRTECEENASMFLKCGGRIEVWGWKKVANRWKLRVVKVEKV